MAIQMAVPAFQEVPVKEKGMVSSVPRKKKHKGKIKENFYLLF
jgi:hypothetical protein